MLKVVLCLLLAAAAVEGGQRCQRQNGVLMYNGKRCASTTNYHDAHKGACGCGRGDNPFDWNQSMFVAAASQYVFDHGGGGWCGSGCGRCVKLTPTGGYVDGEGSAPSNHNAHVFMITNECPIQGNEKWCGQHGPPGTGNINRFGYEAHFDLENGRNQVRGMGWNNPEVTYEFVNCYGGNTPNNGHWQSCECHNHG